MTPLNFDQIIHDGKIKLTGWAYSGSGWPERVEVSGDGGSIWYEVRYTCICGGKAPLLTQSGSLR
jgi:sulfite oxidase